jgi:hypothetical protein
VIGYSLEKQSILAAQGVGTPEGHGGASVKGEGAGTAGGVVEHGTDKEDDPGTWETRVFL